VKCLTSQWISAATEYELISGTYLRATERDHWGRRADRPRCKEGLGASGGWRGGPWSRKYQFSIEYCSQHYQQQSWTKVSCWSIHISKNNFGPVGMAPSERTRSVGAIRDIPVAAYSAPGSNMTCRIADRPPIAVSQFLLALSVYYYTLTLWCRGQLWPHGEMGSFGMRLHRDCNAMGNGVKTLPRINSTSARNAILSLVIIHIIPSHQIYVTIHNPSLVPSIFCLTTSSYPWYYVRAADDVTHSDHWQSNGYRCFPHLYTFRDGIQPTWVFRLFGERQR